MQSFVEVRLALRNVDGHHRRVEAKGVGLVQFVPRLGRRGR